MKGCDLVRVTAGTPPERPGRSVTPPEAGGGSSPAGPYYPSFTDERLRLGLITCCCGRWGCSAPTPHSTTSVPPGPTANCQHLHLLPVVCFWSPKLTLPMDTAGPSAAGVNAPTSSPQPMVTRVGAQTPQLPISEHTLCTDLWVPQGHEPRCSKPPFIGPLSLLCLTAPATS